MNEWTKQLLHLRNGRSVHVSIDSRDDGREFVCVEFDEAGYISLELNDDRVEVIAFSNGDVVASMEVDYQQLQSGEK